MKSCYLYAWSCVIYGEHAAKEKKSRAGTSAWKKVWIATIHVCPILGPLSALLCAKLTFILKSDFGGVCKTQCVCKKGNCISLIEELLRMLKASASACRPVLRISTSCIAYPRRVFSTDYMFPTSVRKRMNPDIRGQAVPPFWLWVDVLGLIFLKDRRVSRDEPWIASTLSHSAAWNRASPFGMASIFPC